MLFGFYALVFPDSVDAGNEFRQWQYRRLYDERVSHLYDSGTFDILLSSYGDNRTLNSSRNDHVNVGWWSTHDQRDA